jgi:hypothetical protein
MPTPLELVEDKIVKLKAGLASLQQRALSQQGAIEICEQLRDELTEAAKESQPEPVVAE